MWFTLFVFIVTKGLILEQLFLYSEAVTSRFPVEPIDGNCSLLGFPISPGETFSSEETCQIITCVKDDDDSYSLELQHCADSTYAENNENCFLDNVPVGSYPDCCPIYNCNSRQKSEENLLDYLTDSQQKALIYSVVYQFQQCLDEPPENVQQGQNYYGFTSTEKKKSFLRTRRLVDELSSEEKLDENLQKEIYHFVTCTHAMQYFDFENPMEVSASEEQRVNKFFECMSESGTINPFAVDFNSRTSIQLLPDIPSILACSADSASPNQVVDLESHEPVSDANPSDESGSLSNEMGQDEFEPENIVKKRQVKNDLTSSEEEALLFYECLSLRPDVIAVVERILAVDIQEQQESFQSSLMRIARQTSSHESLELTEDELEGVILVLECAGVDVEALLNEEDNSR